MSGRALGIALAVLGGLTPSRAAAGEPLVWGVAAQVGGSFESPSLAMGGELNVHAGRWGAHFEAEWNPWFATQDPDSFKPGAVNVGLGGEVNYLGGKARTAVSAGASVLAFRTQLDRGGTVGFYFDVIAVGLRFALSERLDVRLDPLSAHLVAPVLGGIPLVLIEYRSTVGIEWRFR